jgi:mannose-1-phosphate guanylyltransferase
MNYALILAGGRGRRLKPLSSAACPKQFLCFSSGRSMLEETARRIEGLIPKERTYLSFQAKHLSKIRKLKLGIPSENFLLEPKPKNTLAPMIAAAYKIASFDPQAVIAVFPCDHYIKGKEIFLSLLKKSILLARNGYIVALGIKPSGPDSAYGYLKVNKKISLPGLEAYAVESFTEKPSLEKAGRFFQQRRYYWNSGIFIFKAGVFLTEAKKLVSGTYNLISRGHKEHNLFKFWHKLKDISVDYSLMQKTKAIVLLPAGFIWQDLGSPQAIERLFRKDA